MSVQVLGSNGLGKFSVGMSLEVTHVALSIYALLSYTETVWLKDWPKTARQYYLPLKKSKIHTVLTQKVWISVL